MSVVIKSSFALLLVLVPATALAACTSPTLDKLTQFDHYVAARFNVTGAERIDAVQANDQCFWKIEYLLLPSKRTVTLFLSPDGRYATPALFDLSVDPAKERAEKQEATRKLLMGTNVPDPKTGGAVTLTIFSDYECPYCQRLAGMMKDPAVAERLKAADIEFKNFPLSMHPWAKEAAIAGACVRRQNPARLPAFEDAMFAAQRMIRPETADVQIRQVALTVPELDPAKLTQCMSSNEAAADVEADLRLGNQVGVEGTPTVFINGVRQPPFRTPEQLADALVSASTPVSK